MPTYEYTCTDCDSRFDVRRSIAEKPRSTPCPQCGSRKTAQKLSGGRSIPRGRTGSGSRSSCGSCSRSSCSSCSRN